MQTATIRARQKPVEELPAWAVCCPEAREAAQWNAENEGTIEVLSEVWG